MYSSAIDSQVRLKFERGSRAAGIAGVVLGSLALLGWAFQVEALKNPAHVIAMKPNTAACFVLVGVSLQFAGRGALRSRRILRTLLATAAAVIAGLTLLEYLFGWNLGIDELFFSDPYSQFTPAGRMASATALSFLLLGIGLSLVDVRTGRGQRPSEWLAAASLLPPLFGAADYALDWSPKLTGIAVHTVVGLLLLGAALLLARPDEGWMLAVSSPRSGGTAARRLLPFAFVVPLMAGALRWAGQLAGIYSVEFGVALMLTAIISVLVAAVWWNADRLNCLEDQGLRHRELAEAELRRINRALRAINHGREALLRAETESELLQEVCRVVVDDGGYRMAWVGFPEQENGERRVRFVAHRGLAADYAQNANITWDESDRGRGPTGTAIRTGKVQICHDVLTEPRMTPWRAAAIAQGFRASAVFPLKQAGRTFGALSIYSGETDIFQGEEIELLGKLADNLAYGIVVLRAREERRQAEEKAHQASLYARNLLEASVDPLVTIGRDGRIMDVNRATELVTGYDRSRLIGSDFSDYFTEPQKAREGYRQAFADGTVHDYPLSIRHLSGPVTHVLYNATVYRNAAGEVEGVFAAARDITERKRAEEALAHRTAELERSNKELQDFASIASHDLQEPLRKVMAFGDRLRAHSGAALDETGDDYLQRMQNAASRMSSLVEALLDYSRVATKARPFERVDLNRVVSEVLSDLETRIQDSKARVEAGSLPTVMADRLQMQQLLQNLLANALKFHAPDRAPQIQVSAVRANGSWSVIVEDHGVGFDPIYTDRIFRPFQRLHGRAEFPGSGMGLAICRKIVDRHQGTITVRSRPGEGSVFTVTLPADQQEATNDDIVEAECDFDRRGR